MQIEGFWKYRGTFAENLYHLRTNESILSHLHLNLGSDWILHLAIVLGRTLLCGFSSDRRGLVLGFGIDRETLGVCLLDCA